MIVLFLMLSGAMSWAAEAPDPSTASSPRLELAFQLIERGATEVACAQLQTIIEEPTSDEERDRARRTARILHHRDRDVCGFIAGVRAGSEATPTTPPGTLRQVDRSGLAELVVSELAMGALAGAALGLAAQANGDAVLGGTLLGAAMVGGGAGMAGATLGVNPSQAMMVSGAGLAGAGLGTSLGLLVAVNSNDPIHAALGLGVIGFLGGTAGGVALASTFPDAPRGDVALVRSATLWGLGLGSAVGWFPGQRDGRVHVLVAIGGSLAGMGLGVGLAHVVDLPRGSVIAIDLGIYTGIAFGGMVYSSSGGRGRPGYAWTLGGAAGFAAMGALVVLAGPKAMERSAGVPAGLSLSPALVPSGTGGTQPGLSLSGSW